MNEKHQLMSFSMLEDLLQDVVSTAPLKDIGNPEERNAYKDAWNIALKEMFWMEQAIECLQSRIAQLEAERAWVPVSERLPEILPDPEYPEHKISDKVWVDWLYCDLIDDGVPEHHEVIRAMIIDDVWMDLEEGWEIPVGDLSGPSHWLKIPPLPEPYQMSDNRKPEGEGEG